MTVVDVEIVCEVNFKIRMISFRVVITQHFLFCQYFFFSSVLRITKKGGAARLKNFQKENFKEKKLAPPNFVTLPTSSGSNKFSLPLFFFWWFWKEEGGQEEKIRWGRKWFLLMDIILVMTHFLPIIYLSQWFSFDGFEKRRVDRRRDLLMVVFVFFFWIVSINELNCCLWNVFVPNVLLLLRS